MKRVAAWWKRIRRGAEALPTLQKRVRITAARSANTTAPAANLKKKVRNAAARAAAMQDSAGVRREKVTAMREISTVG